MMSETAISDWQARVGLTDRSAATALGISYGSYNALKGNRAKGANKKPLDLRTALACAAIEARLVPDCPEWADRRTVLALAAEKESLEPIC